MYAALFGLLLLTTYAFVAPLPRGFSFKVKAHIYTIFYHDYNFRAVIRGVNGSGSGSIHVISEAESDNKFEFGLGF